MLSLLILSTVSAFGKKQTLQEEMVAPGGSTINQGSSSSSSLSPAVSSSLGLPSVAPERKLADHFAGVSSRVQMEAKLREAGIYNSQHFVDAAKGHASVTTFMGEKVGSAKKKGAEEVEKRLKEFAVAVDGVFSEMESGKTMYEALAAHSSDPIVSKLIAAHPKPVVVSTVAADALKILESDTKAQNAYAAIEQNSTEDKAAIEAMVSALAGDEKITDDNLKLAAAIALQVEGEGDGTVKGVPTKFDLDAMIAAARGLSDHDAALKSAKIKADAEASSSSPVGAVAFSL